MSESWQQGYETGTSEIAAVIDEADAAKRMYRNAQNEALREVKERCELVLDKGVCDSGTEYDNGHEAAARRCIDEIEGLMVARSKIRDTISDRKAPRSKIQEASALTPFPAHRSELQGPLFNLYEQIKTHLDSPPTNN